MDKKEFARYLNEQMALYEKDRLSETKLANALGMSQKSIAEVSWTELLELLASAKTVEELDSRREEIADWIPKVRIMFGFDQRHSAHPYDLWIHTLHVVAALPRGLEDKLLYLGALLHDIGKPATQTEKEDQNGNRYHPNHPAVGAKIVETEILPDLQNKGIWLEEEEKQRLLYYVAHHDDLVGYDVKYLRKQKAYGAINFGIFRNLMYLEVADALAHAQIPIVVRRVEVCGELAGAEGERLWRSMEGKEFFHVHTYRCGHAEELPDEAYVERAIELGAQDIWFSDHAPFPGNPFGHRMKYEQLPEYLDTLQGLKEKYRERLRIHVGLEIEYFESFEAYYQELKRDERLDFLLLGQHMALIAPGKYTYDLPQAERNEKEAVYLVEALIKGMKTGYFDYCAHPDRSFRRRKVWTRDMEDMARELIRTAKEKHVYLEKNLSSLREKHHYWPEFWKLVLPEVKTVVGYDAHSLEELTKSDNQDF